VLRFPAHFGRTEMVAQSRPGASRYRLVSRNWGELDLERAACVSYDEPWEITKGLSAGSFV